MNDYKVNKLILKSAYIVIGVLIIVVIGLLILKYDVEGEKNMPFKLSSIIIISSAEGYQEQENSKYKWDVEIYQNNDIYLNIEKNKNYNKTELIKSIQIENIKINKKPEIGEFKFYRTTKEKNVFTYKEEYEIENQVEYTGDLKTDLSNLKISNQGGTIIIRAVNKTGKRYTSNQKELEHNGKLLEEAGISYKEVKSTIEFDLVINLESETSFKANIEVELPIGNIIEQESSSTEIKDMKNIVFKRE